MSSPARPKKDTSEVGGPAMTPPVEPQEQCYGCSLTERRYLCPFHRRLYTFRRNGSVTVREKGQLSIFRLKGWRTQRVTEVQS